MFGVLPVLHVGVQRRGRGHAVGVPVTGDGLGVAQPRVELAEVVPRAVEHVRAVGRQLLEKQAVGRGKKHLHRRRVELGDLWHFGPDHHPERRLGPAQVRVQHLVIPPVQDVVGIAGFAVGPPQSPSQVQRVPLGVVGHVDALDDMWHDRVPAGRPPQRRGVGQAVLNRFDVGDRRRQPTPGPAPPPGPVHATQYQRPLGQPLGHRRQRPVVDQIIQQRRLRIPPGRRVRRLDHQRDLRGHRGLVAAQRFGALRRFAGSGRPDRRATLQQRSDQPDHQGQQQRGREQTPGKPQGRPSFHADTDCIARPRDRRHIIGSSDTTSAAAAPGSGMAAPWVTKKLSRGCCDASAPPASNAHRLLS